MGSAVTLEVRGPHEDVRTRIRDLQGVESVDVVDTSHGCVRATVTPRGEADLREQLYDLVKATDWSLLELSRQRTTLEDIFVQITRDEDEAEEDRREERKGGLR